MLSGDWGCFKLATSKQGADAGQAPGAATRWRGPCTTWRADTEVGPCDVLKRTIPVPTKSESIRAPSLLQCSRQAWRRQPLSNAAPPAPAVACDTVQCSRSGRFRQPSTTPVGSPSTTQRCERCALSRWAGPTLPLMPDRRAQVRARCADLAKRACRAGGGVRLSRIAALRTR